MSKSRGASPTIQLQITDEQHERAVQSNSGGCLIADAIKTQYPHLTAVSVDMATIRFTDKKAGCRYVYLTPPSAQHILLSFDQGWPQPVANLVLKRAVQVQPIRASNTNTIRRARRRAELETKEHAGTLTQKERASLRTIRATPDRQPNPGRATVEMVSGVPVVVGGQPLKVGPNQPNLLRGRNRHFGARLADPGQVFRDAVDAAVAERLAAPTDDASA